MNGVMGSRGIKARGKTGFPGHGSPLGGKNRRLANGKLGRRQRRERKQGAV